MNKKKIIIASSVVLAVSTATYLLKADVLKGLLSNIGWVTSNVSTYHNESLPPVIPLSEDLSPVTLENYAFTTANINKNRKVTRITGNEAQQYSQNISDIVKIEMVAVKGNARMNSFWIGKYEVTQEQWIAVMGNNPSYFRGDRLPVEMVSWNEVKIFCNKLNEKLGLSDKSGYRLPTKSEWEYAARSGKRTEYAFGDRLTTEIENYNGNIPYDENESSSYRGKFRRGTVEVGSLGVANLWGLYDMHGNVMEWCEDRNVDIPEHQPYHNYRAIRGGWWFGGELDCRLNIGLDEEWDSKEKHYGIGFRLLIASQN